MAFTQPKRHMESLKLRGDSVGDERRRMLAKYILEKGTPLPKPVEYEDLDKEIFSWLDKKIDIVYDGKRLPTYRLFSNQKISEYTQTWSNLDDTNNIVMNFKSITRENNPQKGENQGNFFNIPGNRHYPMFCEEYKLENGEIGYKLYSMTQPMSVNLMYTVSIICNKYELLNKFNEMMHAEFKALQCYIRPNGHYMPMTLENISDESEYAIDDRRYYSQSFQVKLMAYIIRREDFKVSNIPSRFVVKMNTATKTTKRTKRSDNWLDVLSNATLSDDGVIKPVSEKELPRLDEPTAMDICEGGIEINAPKPPKHPISGDNEIEDASCCTEKEESKYRNVEVRFIVSFPYCEKREHTFTVEHIMDIESIETENVHDFVMRINGEVCDLENDVRLNVGDEVSLDMTREDDYKGSKITIVGSDPENVYNIYDTIESLLDEPVRRVDYSYNEKTSGAV